MDFPENCGFIELCRLCLSQPGSCSILETTHLLRDIFVCTGVEVSVTDTLPTKICNHCNEIIQKSIAFRTLVTENNLYLKSLCPHDIREEELNEDLVTSTITSEENKSSYLNQEVEIKQLQISDKIGQNDNKSSAADNCTHTPMQLQTLSIRKDLFPTSTQNVPNEENIPQSSVKRRKIKTEPIEVVEYRCGPCSKNFETWKKLYLHSRLHTKNIACTVEACGKMFATRGDLEKHVRTHTGEKPYQCNLCQRKFTQKCSLKSHMETVHSEEE
ncbi:unnamed protein product, partial [Iphiclides podalirius]